MNQKNLRNILALALIPYLNPITAKLLIERFPNLEELFQASDKTLAALGLPIISHLKNPAWNQVDRHLKWAAAANCHIISILDNNYPARLKEIISAPLVLFAKGDINILSNLQIAIVGSRNPTVNGKEIAHIFAHDLAKNELTITSGLALGIDSESHRGAITAQKTTIAVLGSGLDIIYPRSNCNLAQEIEQHGLLITEFPLGTQPTAMNFPQRNRIISGLSLGVLVVEATLKSGSLITANYALEQGREVFAIPGSIYNSNTRGCHALIKQGAKLVETVTDILEELNLPTLTKITVSPGRKNIKTKNNLDLRQQKLLECINYEATPVDILIKRSGFSAQEATPLLISLELLDLIANVPGGYCKKN